ncbi:MAG: helix-hairpin-helix domain-containing protein, partial [Nanoarchaeota archaeon]
MHEFFAKTYSAHQFKDMQRLESIKQKMQRLLEEWGFITVAGSSEDFVAANEMGDKKLRPTAVGKRVSELYLDPLTARHILDCLAGFDDKKNAFSLLQMVSNTLEMRPLLSVKSKEQEKIQEELNRRIELLLKEEPSAYDIDYDDFISSIKTALFFESWIEEKDEDFLLETFGIRPGEIKVKQDSADWLLHASEELASMNHHHGAVTEIRKLRVRVEYGVKEELLALLKLKGIGRIRARKLYLNGIKNVGDLKKVDTATLSQLLGKAVADSVKKQVGEEVLEISKGARKGQTSILKF